MAEILRKNSMLYPLLIGLVFFILFPQITEHVEFAKILVGEIEYDQYNPLDKRAKEFSSQIIIPAVLIDFGMNGFLLQFLMSFLLTCIPFFSIFYISQALNPKDTSSAIKLFLITSIILFVVEITNLNSYPIQFPTSYAEFGNSGMWMMLLIVGLLLCNKPVAGFFIGFLFSWHVIWFFGTIIFVFTYFLKESNRKSYEKILKFSILFVLGCVMSFFLYRIGMSYKEGAMVDESYSLFQIVRNMLSEPELVVPNLNNAHNIHILSSGIRGALEKLFFLLFPLFFIMINSKNMNVSVFVNKIKAPLVLLSIVSFCCIFYVEIARFVALPGAETLVSRAIMNRYLNVNIVISIMLIIHILIKFMENKSRKSFEIYEVLFLMISSVFLVGYLLVLVSILIYFLFLAYNYLSGKTFLLNYVRDSLSKIIVFVFFVLILMKVYALHQVKYSLYSYLSPTDNVFLYLSEYEGNKSIVLGPTIPAIHSLNVGFLTDRDYYVMREDVRDRRGAISNLYCQISGYGDVALTVGSVKECFEQRSTKQWRDILELHDSSLVVVTSDVKLNMGLEASNKYFSIYNVE